MYFPQKTKIKSVSKEREEKITKCNIFMLQSIQKSITIYVTVLVINKILFFNAPLKNQLYQFFRLKKPHTFQASSINE